MGRKLAVDPRQIEHRCNRAHLVIVRHHLFKAERIKQLLLIALQPPHHGLPPPPNPSTSENHCSRQPSTDFCNKIGTKQTSQWRQLMSASLIGRLGSSAFRLSTTIAVSMSLTGSCFSSESAPRPFHHGIRRRGGTILWAALPSVERQVQADIRTHLIHRPARDIFPPLGGARVFLLSRLILHRPYAAVTSRVHRHSVSSTPMPCMITANRRASATIAFFIPRCLAIFMAQALSQDHFVVRTSMIWAAS